MAKQSKKGILVYADWQDLGGAILMGELTAEPIRGKEVFSFDYSTEWLEREEINALDPDLYFVRGRQYLSDGKPNFGVFLDSSPDRWGRLLMKRRESAIARKEERNENPLYETDYLLGVFDGSRMGALRLKTDEAGPFLNDNKELASPPWTSLRELEHASLCLEDDDAVEQSDYLKWLNMLMAPGSSLGGARPKASVIDEKTHLWIAKFPSKNDTSDNGAWEFLTHQLAKSCGLWVAEAKALRLTQRHHTFLTKRFDRIGQSRVHFASAMTLLGHQDGDGSTTGASYLELAEIISRWGAEPKTDLEQLWRRIVFNICVSNTDDHLRNHGFLLSPTGWRLSPAYDMNPIETGTGLKLNISENDNALDLGLALSVAPYFELDDDKANEIIETVKKSVSKWADLAKQLGISASERDLMSRAFTKATWG